MAHGMKNTGEELIARYVWEDSSNLPAQIDIGLYNDIDDDLGDDATTSDIDTEPNGGSYSRQRVGFKGSFTATFTANKNWESEHDKTITFDVSNESRVVDSYFVLGNYVSYTNGTDYHILWTGGLAQRIDLDNRDSLDVDNVGIIKD